MTLRLPESDARLLAERAARERRSEHDPALEAIHRLLTERHRRFDGLLADSLEANRELLDRLAE